MGSMMAVSAPANLPDYAQQLKDRLGTWDKVRQDTEAMNAVFYVYGIKIDEDKWNRVVDLAEEYEKNRVKFKRLSESQALSQTGYRMALKDFPSGGYWDEYYRTLCEKYSIPSAQAIRTSCEMILTRLTLNEGVVTAYREPVKGAVFGSVQSGKTSNMEGIIAMGADQGFNMFVILSGNITILKDQTIKRINKDFSGNNRPNIIDVNLFKKDRDSINPNQKNIIVCLKTDKSLKKLHSIITKDESTRRRLKVIVMDDEGDLATPDGSSESAEQRATINRHVMSIVNCCPLNKPEDPYDRSYEAMNYISYTATPFAVLLNESGPKTLYPRDFIISLPTSDRYFGPCQIFGCNYPTDVDYCGMPIVNASADMEERFSPFERDEGCDTISDELLDSICWFVCCVAVLRLHEWKSPVSMLINTNSRTDQHRIAGRNVMDYLRNHPEEVEAHCEAVYHEQTSKFSLEDLKRCYPDYYGSEFDDHVERIIRYPRYDEIRDLIHEIIEIGPTQIPICEGDPVFGNGIHICVEDSAKTILEDSPFEVHTRVIYPDKCDIFAPAFLVIGGNAISRGFTLEGLVSTFFIRPVTQADTLMQMGRWFGYRQYYELLPRIWMSTSCKEDFEFLANLDMDLRGEMRSQNELNQPPSKFARRILAIPEAIRLKRLTARNKSKGMVYADLSYSGKRQEFASFILKEGLLENNYDTTVKFLQSLSSIPGVIRSETNREMRWGNVVRWNNVPLSVVLNDFIKKFQTGISHDGYDDCMLLEKWMDGLQNKEVLNSWTIALVGKENGRPFEIEDGVSVGMVVRGKEPNTEPDIIKIKTLWSKSDYFRDIFPNEIPDESIVKKIRSADYSEGFMNLRRDERLSAGMSDTPSLFIYCIDGKGHNMGEKKIDLNLDTDVVAFFIDVPHVVLPGDTDRVRIRLDPEE